MSTYCALTPIQHSVLNMKAPVGTFNQEKVLVGAFSVIVNLRVIIANVAALLQSDQTGGGAGW